MNDQQKVAVITGASQGIGAGLVKGFRNHGYCVVANSRSITARIAGADPDIVTVDGDIADPRTAERVIGTAVSRFGRVDTLVNNAGIFISQPFIKYTTAEFAAVTSVNLAGFMYVSQMAIIQMLQQNSGHVVNITTSLADQPMAGLPAAMAALTKGGLNAVTRSLAIEYAGTGLRVNAVSPGIIKTPMHAPANHGYLAGLHPMRRMGEIAEVVDAVLYLESAAFITGEVLHVDGGQHAGHW